MKLVETMEAINRLIILLISKEIVEANFKLLSYLGAATLAMGLAKYASAQSGWIHGIPFVLLFIILLVQSFFYGLQAIVFPAGAAIWPKVDYMSTIEFLQNKSQEHRIRILRELVISKPGIFLVVSYIALFYYLNGVLGVLISKSGIA